MESNHIGCEAPVDIAALPARVRWFRAARALARVLANSDDTEQVLLFSSYANAGRSKQRMALFFSDPRGNRLYTERKAIDTHTIDIEKLIRLPTGTLGYEYARFMKVRGITPEVFDGPPGEFGDPRHSYVVQRMRQTHDLWHVVTNTDTNPEGEIALQAFTYAQAKALSSGILAILGALGHLLRSTVVARDALALYRLGRKARNLAVFPWEDHWSTQLTQVRCLLGLPEHLPLHGCVDKKKRKIGSL